MVWQGIDIHSTIHEGNKNRTKKQKFFLSHLYEALIPTNGGRRNMTLQGYLVLSFEKPPSV